MTEPTVDVLFIAGIGRSGTTLLSRLLGAIDGVENLGEFASLWTVADLFHRNLPCGCGNSMDGCPRWEGWRDVGLIGADGQTKRVSRNLEVFRRNRITEAARQYVGEELGRRYARVARETGARLLVDASKRPAVAMAAAAAPNVNLHIAHMVRDPRAVAASRSQPKAYLRRIPAWSIGARWTAVNLAAERVGRLAQPRALIRYEDMIDRPQATLGQLLKDLSLAGLKVPDIFKGAVDVGTQHSLAGNPDKLGDTTVTIHPSRPTRLRFPDTALVALMTAPVRKRYGY